MTFTLPPFFGSISSLAEISCDSFQQLPIVGSGSFAMRSIPQPAQFTRLSYSSGRDYYFTHVALHLTLMSWSSFPWRMSLPHSA